MVSYTTDKEVIELIDNFFLKSTLLICSTKSNKLHAPLDQEQQFDEDWFLSKTDEESALPEIIKQWSTFDGNKELPPLVIETFLDLRGLGPFHNVTLKDDEGNSWNVCRGTKKSEIVLERWLIELDSVSAAFKSHKISEEEANNSSRQFVLLFRYLYTLTQLLPANDLYLSLSRSAASHGTPPLMNVATRILDGSKPILSKGRIGLSKPIISTYSNIINESNVPSHLEQRKITPVWTKYGLLRVSVSYRHDCYFQVHQEGDDDNYPLSTQLITEQAMRRSSHNQQQSMSLSPHGYAGSSNSMEQQFLPKKPLSISRQLQPFKVGSVGSAPIPQPHVLTRNPSSSSSILANLQARRSSNSSTWAPNAQIVPHQDLAIEGTSVGSVSKYSSSFGRIRRHSSVKNSETLPVRPTKPVKITDAQNEDLLDFVKMMNDRPELNIKKSPRASVDISNSLIKFQNLKPTNDLISENLNLSLSLDPSHTFQQHRSNSHSPLPSFSPNLHYPSIPSKISQARSFSHDGESVTGSVTSRRNSSDVSKPPIAGYHRSNSSVSSRRHSGFERETTTSMMQDTNEYQGANDERIETDEEDDDLVMSSVGLSTAKIKSMESISTSMSRNRLPIPQPSNYSQPTTTAVPAYAKLHRPGSRSTSSEVQKDDGTKTSGESTNVSGCNDRQDSSSHGEEDDDEDLLFFMSDMNLSKI